MSGFPDITSRLVALLEPDIDTDQMVPARFLRTASSSGLGKVLFYDRRYTESGAAVVDFPLNPPRYQGETILLAGANFGCGSSREHAPWALREFGIRAIIAPSFADIFYNNCLKNGLLAVTLSAADHAVLREASGAVTISLARNAVFAAERELPFRLDPFARYCLMQGVDQFEFIRQSEPQIARFEAENANRFPSFASLLSSPVRLR